MPKQHVLIFVGNFILLMLILSDSSSDGMTKAFFIACLGLLNLVLSAFYFIKNNKKQGKIYLFAMILLFLIGFGVCLTNFKVG